MSNNPRDAALSAQIRAALPELQAAHDDAFTAQLAETADHVLKMRKERQTLQASVTGLRTVCVQLAILEDPEARTRLMREALQTFPAPKED